MSSWEIVVGVETHVQLRTKSKLFCGCEIRFAAPPNSLTCPVCLGHPGTLPVINRGAFDLALRAALALNCEIAPTTKFDRKNYYYPDLPKNYQISQYDQPFSHDGWIEIPSEAGPKKVRIQRAHLEEDAGKLQHEEGGRRSFVDLNRAGVPLVEIVTHPDIRSTDEAYAYLTQLKEILEYADVSGCDMEKGELRCDMNVSIRPKGETKLGVKTEIKNLNSFKNAKRALELEYQRHVKTLESGGRIIPSTWLYDAEKDETRMMRSKEEAAEYRYFPEPDLPPVKIGRDWVDQVRKTLPELPAAKRERFLHYYGVISNYLEKGITEYDARILASHKILAQWFEDDAKAYGDPKTVANWYINEFLKQLNDNKVAIEAIPRLPGPRLTPLLRLISSGATTVASGRMMLWPMFYQQRKPEDLLGEWDLAVITDSGTIEAACDKIIAANAKAVADYKGGKEASLKFLVGQVMKETKGKVKAPQAEEILKRKLS